MPLTQEKYGQYRDSVARLFSRFSRSSTTVAKIDSLPVSLDEKADLLAGAEKLVSAFQALPVNTVIISGQLVERLDELAARVSKQGALSPAAFAKVVETAEARLTRANDWQDAYAVLDAFNHLTVSHNFNTPAHVKAALDFVTRPAMDAKKFERIAGAASECFKTGAATTPQHFKELFAAAEKMHDAAEKHGLSFADYSAATGRVGVFVSLSKAFRAVPHRLNVGQAKDLIALTTAAIETDAQLPDVERLLTHAADELKTQTPPQITRTIDLLARTARQHGGEAAGKTAEKMTKYNHLGHDTRFRIIEKALQSKLRPQRALETYANALQEAKNAAGDVEDGIEHGVLLGPVGRDRLKQAIFSRKRFFDDARKTVKTLETRRPQDSFEAELRDLHY